MQRNIVIRGARAHNLKNIDLIIPRDRLVVLTGLSGSGKSSLAFDTIYAEGQRRYVESLSAYARQFLEIMQKPDVDEIDGLSPAISIEQKTTSKNPRSTVGTVTEIYDYLRLLWARVGVPYSPATGLPIQSQTIAQMVDRTLALPPKSKIHVLAPVVRGRKGEYRKELAEFMKKGFQRLKIDGTYYDIEDAPSLNRKIKHDIDVVVDRLIVRGEETSRLAESFETALNLAEGLAAVEYKKAPVPAPPGNESEASTEEEYERVLFSSKFSCPISGFTLPEIEPRLFSFNNPFGACPDCLGLGVKPEDHFMAEMMEPLDRRSRFRRYPAKNRPPVKAPDDELEDMRDPQFRRAPCPNCEGYRLKPAALCVKIHAKHIGEIAHLSLKETLQWMMALPAHLNPQENEIAKLILKEICDRLQFLHDVGLEYLTLARASGTLSGGESQRIRLASQIGSRLTGVLYVLDEPSIGLHQRDNARLLATLRQLRDLGNSVLVVEHDEDAIRIADHIIDIGPGAGIHGGYKVAQGKIEDIINAPDSLTGDYLIKRKIIAVPPKRRVDRQGRFLKVVGAQGNNLKNLTISIPLGVFTCVTGVSGSGKSTFVIDTLYKALSAQLTQSETQPAPYSKLEGLNHIDKIIDIDQNPIGRTPRSNPATYVGAFAPIREWFAGLPEARARGYSPGRFSFNVKGGRCEACEGAGLIKVEMHFLPDVYVTCEQCRGKRYDRETLAVRYQEHSISDVLEMTTEEAANLFQVVPSIHGKMLTLQQVGLSYIKLGQPANTLSGGEAQRVKLAKELSKRPTGRTLYILDEPTTGLHFHDVAKLLEVLHRLVDQGNSVLVIEHNLDVIKTADWVIDFGPEGGDGGGEVLAEGTPEEIIQVANSYTGQFLKPLLLS